VKTAVIGTLAASVAHAQATGIARSAKPGCPPSGARVLERSVHAVAYTRSASRTPKVSVCAPRARDRRPLGRLTSTFAVALTGRWAVFARIEGGANTAVASWINFWEDPAGPVYPFTVALPSDPSVRHGDGEGAGDHLAVPKVVVTDQGVAAWVVCRPAGALDRCAARATRCIWSAHYSTGASIGIVLLDRSGGIIANSLRLSPDGHHALWNLKHGATPKRAVLTPRSTDEQSTRRCT
jgi:hypothetical protein